MATYIALLRGVNVGGRKLPMADLRATFDALGHSEVRTYIQSGNVVFSADSGVSERLAHLIAEQIAQRYGYRLPVVLRTTKQLRIVTRNNPFLQAGEPEETLHVMFLADLPDPGRVESLDPQRSPPDTFVVRDQEIYLHLPHGVADTKLTNSYFDSKLATISTGRNWRTVTKLLALMEEGDASRET